MKESRQRAAAWALLAALHVALACVYCASTASGDTAARLGFPLDDAWIHMVYGRALFEHGAPFYNPGQLEAGFSSPLWMLVVAVAHWVGALTGASVVLVVKGFGVVAGAAGSVLLYEASFVATSRRSASLFAAVLLATHPFVAFSQVSGMEASLTGALMLATATAWLEERWTRAGVLLALACWARPECAVLLPFAAFAVVARASRERNTTVTLSRALVPALAALAAWSAYCLAVTKHPLPNTFYVKHDHHDALGSAARSLHTIWFDAPTGALGASTLLTLVGGASFCRSIGRRAVAPLFAPWAFVVGVGVTRQMPDAGDRFFYFLRYLVPALPLALLPLSEGLSRLRAGVESVGRASGKLTPGFFRVVGTASTVLLGTGCFLAYPASHRAEVERYSWNTRNIEDGQVRIGKLIAENVAADAAVISDDAGAIRYFGDRTTVDLIGLNHHVLLFSPEAARFITRVPKALDQFAGIYHASTVVLHPVIFGKLTGDPRLSDFFQLVSVIDVEHFTVASELEGRFWVLSRLKPPVPL